MILIFVELGEASSNTFTVPSEHPQAMNLSVWSILIENTSGEEFLDTGKECFISALYSEKWLL